MDHAAPVEQRRGQRIAMTVPERDGFLTEERTCRIASVGADGAPHVSALWFVWDGTALWLTSIVKSQRWTNLMRDPRASVLVDGGHGYGELRGVELIGSFEVVGEVPRTGEPVEALVAPEEAFARKYTGRPAMGHDQRHAWVRMVPTKLVTWDFRKIGP
jgi:hypothetical protein